MTTTIRVSCPDCWEESVVGPGDVQLTVTHVESFPIYDERTRYTFPCLHCDQRMWKPATAYVISMLMSGGVRATRVRIPAEAVERHVGPPISYDDILDFQAGFDTASGRDEWVVLTAEWAMQS